MIRAKLVIPPGKVMLPRCKGDYDGFSGGPVFGLSTATRSIELRGVIIRGGIDKLFFAPVDWVQRLCEVALARPQIEQIAA